MKILFDGTIFKIQRAGGINRYFAEVISGLPANYYPIITGVEDVGKNAPSHPNLELSRFTFFRPSRISSRLHDVWWKPSVLGALTFFLRATTPLPGGISFPG